MCETPAMSERTRVAYTVMQCWHRVPGGSATSVLSLAGALADRDDVDLVGIGPWFGGQPPAAWVPPIPVRRLPVPYQLAYEIWNRTSLLSPTLVVPDADVVHATTVTVPAKGRAKGLVVTVHDLFPVLTPEQFTPRGVRIMTGGIEAARKRADIVCCPSQDTLDDCLEAGFDADRLRLVPWGATEHRVTVEDRRTVRDTYRLDRPFILWVGTIEPRKNLPTLLEAFRRLQPTDVDLVLVGPIGWHEQLEGHIEGIGSKVRQLGFVPPAHLPALYAEASLFCFPSIREGFGLPALEAMAQGTPVIASSATAVAEVVGPDGLTVPALDVDAWAGAIGDLLADDAGRDRLAAAGRRRAAGFTWERCAEQMAEIYREAAS
jgi:glycosyltransferase involved in cell wall biosynthesis